MINYGSYARNLSSFEIKALKIFRLDGVRIPDLCDTGAVLCQLS